MGCSLAAQQLPLGVPGVTSNQHAVGCRVQRVQAHSGPARAALLSVFALFALVLPRPCHGMDEPILVIFFIIIHRVHRLSRLL